MILTINRRHFLGTSAEGHIQTPYSTLAVKPADFHFSLH